MNKGERFWQIRLIVVHILL